MSRLPVPVRERSYRVPEAGRIRLGIKGPKGEPVKLDRFRFTSPDPIALGQLAGLYGGTVRPWSDPRAAANQHEVITDAREIRIALPPNALGGGSMYELWDAKGNQRRCDGVTCVTSVPGPDGPEPGEVPCICVARNAVECKMTTRLSVILPDIRFTGLWRLDTHGYNAADELPGFVESIRSVQNRGIVSGLLRLEDRKSVANGQTRRFVVPVLGLDLSMEALAAGRAQVGSLGQVAVAGEIGSGTTDGQEPTEAAHLGVPAPVVHDDDEVVDAELVGDEDPDDLMAAADSVSKRNRALRAARGVAERKGLPQPATFEEITEPVLVNAAMTAVRANR